VTGQSKEADRFFEIAHREMAFRDDPGVPRGLPMLRCLEDAKIFAGTDYPILIEGPTGTGKERLARVIHRASPRAGRSLVTFSCPDVVRGDPSSLHSELFGHKKGAFTGADAARKGRIESAEGSTLFIDEIDKAPLDLQVKLLRLIQEKEYTKLGSDDVQQANVRFLFASAAELNKLVSEGKFSRDLLARISGRRLHLPPLAERGYDVLVILLWVLARLGAIARGIRFLSYNACDFLHWYDWPNNIRELETMIENAVTFTLNSGSPDTITFDSIRRCFPEEPITAREFAERVGACFKDRAADSIDAIWREGWDDFLVADRWEALQRVFMHPTIARYVNAKTYPHLSDHVDYEQESEFWEDTLKEIYKGHEDEVGEANISDDLETHEKLRLRFIRVLDVSKPQRRESKSFYSPGPINFDPRPEIEWIDKKADWETGCEAKCVFFAEADTKYVLNLKSIYKEHARFIFARDEIDQRLRDAGFHDSEIAEICGVGKSAISMRKARRPKSPRS
jgi:transcriptional regulator with AAA-type ATPase domain